MEMKTIKEVLDCLPTGKTAFNYYKDRYAVFLLSQVIGRQCAIADLKKSVYSGLLHKPLVKDVMAQSGDGILYKEQLEMAWSMATEPFLLTLDSWAMAVEVGLKFRVLAITSCCSLISATSMIPCLNALQTLLSIMNSTTGVIR
jgi:hypothetical protein